MHFKLIRFFFLLGSMLCIVFALINIPILLADVYFLEQNTRDYTLPLETNFSLHNSSASFHLIKISELLTWKSFAVMIWFVFFAKAILSILNSFRSIYKLKRNAYRVERYHKATVFYVNQVIAPFSFGRYIFINPRDINDYELSVILSHEYVHVKEGHSFDVMILKVINAIVWFCPINRKFEACIHQNLEFIVDRNIIMGNEISYKDYQYLLLKIAQINTKAPVNWIHSFAKHSLKNRIIMINAIGKSKYNTSKILFAFTLFFTTGIILKLTKAAPIYVSVNKPIIELDQQDTLNVNFLKEHIVDSLPIVKPTPFKIIKDVNQFTTFMNKETIKNVAYLLNGKLIQISGSDVIQLPSFKHLNIYNAGEAYFMNQFDNLSKTHHVVEIILDDIPTRIVAKSIDIEDTFSAVVTANIQNESITLTHQRTGTKLQSFKISADKGIQDLNASHINPFDWTSSIDDMNTTYTQVGLIIDGENIVDPKSYTINSDVIYSIRMLDQATATSYYGSQYANGVVIIYTKDYMKKNSSEKINENDLKVNFN